MAPSRYTFILQAVARVGRDIGDVGRRDGEVDDGDGTPIAIAATPHWWPATSDDAAALAWWRGSSAAVHWMAEVIAHR